MRAIYDARISGSGLGDLVAVERGCGHTETLTASMLTTAGVAPQDKIQDLTGRLRCRECDAKGRAVVSIKWGRDGVAS